MPNTSVQFPGQAPRPQFEEYAERFSDFFKMKRRDGIIEIKMHTKGGPWLHGFAGTQAWAQAWTAVGSDPENECVIITGTGSDFFTAADPTASAPIHERPANEVLQVFYDAIKVMENFVFGIDVPTIAAINGPAPAHAEFALACDLTICSDDTVMCDPHFLVGAAPGDGMGLALQELLGSKRAAYYLYTCNGIDAATALDLGLVNEVLTPERLLPRAWELAEMIMSRPPAGRRMTHALISRPWKQRLVQDLGFHLYHEIAGLLVDRPEPILHSGLTEHARRTSGSD